MFSALGQLLDKFPSPPNFTNDHAPMLAVATLHATILAIVLGVLATYGLYRRTVRDQLEMKLLQEARAINSMYYEPPDYIPEEAITEAKQLSKSISLTDLVGELKGIILNGENVKRASLDVKDGRAAPDDAAAIQGTRAFRLTLALALHPPFQEVSNSFSVPNPVYLPDIATVQRWVKKLDEVTSPLIQAHESAPQGLTNVLSHYLIPVRQPDLFPYQSFESFSAPFFKYLQAGYAIRHRVNEQLQEIDRHQRSGIGTLLLALGFFGASLTFVCSVIIPLLDLPNPLLRKVVFWEPIAFYSVALVGIACLIFRR
jgi:hypothetical protein